MARIWDLISNQALADLMRWQHKHYPGVKLEPPVEDKQLVTIVGKIEDIEEIIDDCINLSSFDDKSEDKMSSWLELGSGELHRKSLFSLRRIRKEMNRYFGIHLDMDIE